MKNHKISHIGLAGLKLKLGFQAFGRAIMNSDLKSYVRLYALMVVLAVLGEAARPHVALALNKLNQWHACSKLEAFHVEKTLKYQGIHLTQVVLPSGCAK